MISSDRDVELRLYGNAKRHPRPHARARTRSPLRHHENLGPPSCCAMVPTERAACPAGKTCSSSSSREIPQARLVSTSRRAGLWSRACKSGALSPLIGSAWHVRQSLSAKHWKCDTKARGSGIGLPCRPSDLPRVSLHVRTPFPN